MRISVAKKHSGIGNKEISVETDCVIGLIQTLLICGIFSCQTSAYRELSKQTRSKEKNASEVRFILQYPVCASSFFYSCQPAFLFFDFRRTLDSKSAHEIHYFRRAHAPITVVQVTLIKSLPLSLFSSHHHLVHTPHGWGRHLGWSHRHHLPWTAALLRLLTVPQEILWQRLLSHSGPRRNWEDDSSAKWHHTQSSQRGMNRGITTSLSVLVWWSYVL